MLKTYYKEIGDEKVTVLRDPRPGSWISLETSSEQDLKKFSKKFKLDEDILKDVLDIYEAPRIETDKNNVYLFMTFPNLENEVTFPLPVLIVLNHDYIFTISSRPMPFVEKLLKSEIPFSTVDKNELLVRLLQNIYHQFNVFIHRFSRRIRQKGVQLEKISNNDIVQFVNFESVLNDFLFDFIPASNVFTALLSGKVVTFTKEQRVPIDDLMLSNNQLIEIARSNLKNMVNIREAYSTIMTNNLNRVIKTFTSLTVVLTIPTMIASIYGMNVKLPFDQDPHAFIGILSVIIIISVVLVGVFFKKDWL